MPSSAGVPTTNGPSVIASKRRDDASRDTARVILAATELSGEANIASSWFSNKSLSAFGSQTAQQLVRDGRTDDVLAYLQSLEAGAAG